MERYDLSRQMELARYLPLGSPLHRLHPGAKLLLIILGVSLLVAATGIIVLAEAFFAICLLTALARVPFSVPFRSLWRASPWLVIVIVIQILTARAGNWGAEYARISFIHLRGGQTYLAIESALRFSDLILFLVLAITFTDTGELSYAIEAILSPFSKIGIPVRGVALTVTIALYFMPLLATEADRIVRSQASRGADFSSKGRGIVGRVRVYAPLFVPLIVLSLRHAENLARAMEARGYSRLAVRARLIVYPLRVGSVVTVLAAMAVVALLFVDPQNGWDTAIRGWFI